MKNSSFYWCIASYKRPERQHMLSYLSGMGYTKDEIIISTQNEEDYRQYSDLYSKVSTVIYKEGRNISDNKNTLLDYARSNLGNSRIVMCSDKVRAVQYLGKDGKLHQIEDKATMDRLVERAFSITKKLHGEIWGCYSVGNAFFMKHTVSTNMQILGCFMGIADPSLQKFDPEQPLKEDFEYVLRHVMHKRKTVRFNDICLKATLHTKGGCFSAWHDKEIQRVCNERILKKYVGLVTKHPTRENEQKYIGPTDTYNGSILCGVV